MTIKIMLADDHALVQEGLVAILQLDPELEVIATANDGQQALDQLASCKPDILVMDIRMPNLHGIDATRLITEQYPLVKVLILSMHENNNYILNALKAGAKGYLLKTSSTSELINAIKTINNGQRYVSQELSFNLLDDIAPEPDTTKISNRERQVLVCIAQGLSNKEIATQLHISVRTVEVHRLNLKKKLKIDNSARLICYAIEQGFVQQK
ncbi:MAG: response regulator transcription factor [Gammaproteobacteria bacterium]|nr:response regulator transcription factor [Gammaproteobacteria bacterium]